MNARVEQDGRSVTLSGEGKMTANVSLQWQKVAGRLLPASKPSASPHAADGAARAVAQLTGD